MSIKKNGDPAAAALARKRWEKQPAKKRSAHAKKMAAARWGKPKSA